MNEPTWTEVDGVPVVWLRLPGQVRAVLSFRVGVADETATTHGISHLTEHLALHGMHDRTYQLNGSTDLTATRFYCAGTRTDVADFFGTVCAALGSLPAERVEVERQVLRAEGEQRKGVYRDSLLYMRYGAQGFGLPMLAETGLRWLDAETVRDWAATRFTRQNAILWMTAPPPKRLRLPLADGPVHPRPPAEAVETVIPGWYRERAAGMAVGLTIPRTYAGGFAGTVLVEEANRRLRFEQGLTYNVLGVRDRLDGGTSHVSLSADAAPERHAELRDGLLTLLDDLATDGAADDAMARINDRWARADDEMRALSYLDMTAALWLDHREIETRAEFEERSVSTTREEVAAVARIARDSALVLLPERIDPPTGRYSPVPLWCPRAVAGETFAGMAQGVPQPDRHAVAGDEGISLVTRGGIVTIRWADVVMNARWRDGSRMLLARDGFRITVVPADWAGGARLVDLIDDRAPAGVAVPYGDTGPRPATAPPPPPPPPRPSRRLSSPSTRRLALGFGYFVGVALLAAAMDGPHPATASADEVTTGDVVFTYALAIAVLTACVVATVRARRPRRPRQAERRSVHS